MKKNLTINDIAKMANVSKSTISRYFNNGYVKQETREKINEVIQACNYELNTFARLKAKKKKIIGIIVPCFDSLFASKMLMSIDSYLGKQGYISLIMNSNHNSDMELKHIHALKQMNVDGIILSATQLTKAHKELIENVDIPIVVVGQAFKERCVVNDDYNAACFLAEQVVAKGYNNILFLTVDKQDEAIGKLRQQGVVETLKKHKINYEVLISDFRFDNTKKILEHYLKEKKPGLILCSSTSQLLACYKVLEEHNLSIPNDIAVCGFGGYDYVDLLKPSISSIQFDTHIIGETSAKMMLNILDDIKIQKEVIPYKFFNGNSM